MPIAKSRRSESFCDEDATLGPTSPRLSANLVCSNSTRARILDQGSADASGTSNQSSPARTNGSTPSPVNFARTPWAVYA